MYKFITLTNGKRVQAFYEADEDQVAKIVGSAYDFKTLSDGKIAQKIAFVDADGNKIKLFGTPPILSDGNTVKWFDYLENVTKDGSDFTSIWDNKTGINGIIPGALLQAVGANQPLWSANGILFDGVDDFMKTAAFTLVQPEMIYIVFKQVSWTANDRVFDGNANITGALVNASFTPNLRVYAGAFSGENINSAVGSVIIARVLFNGASSEFTINETIPLSGDFGANDMGGFTIGANGGNIQCSNIEVKEIIIRKIADTPTNEQIIYDYLAAKYSI